MWRIQLKPVAHCSVLCESASGGWWVWNGRRKRVHLKSRDIIWGEGEAGGPWRSRSFLPSLLLFSSTEATSLLVGSTHTMGLLFSINLWAHPELCWSNLVGHVLLKLTQSVNLDTLLLDFTKCHRTIKFLVKTKQRKEKNMVFQKPQ